MRGSGIRRRATVIASVIGALMLLCAGSASAAKKPDLVVASVVSPPAEASLGGELPVKVTVQNKGKKTSKASKLGLALSSTSSASALPEAELASLDTPAIKPRKKKVISGVVEIPGTADPGGPFYLLACADRTGVVKETKEANNCKASASGATLSPPPSVYELIDAEYEAGDITLGDALLFKAYADTSDPRLPARFGPPPDEEGDSNVVMKQISAKIETLPQAELAQVDPFLKPPIYDGAYFPGATTRRQFRRGTLGGTPCAGPGTAPTISSNWSSIATTHFRIHYFTQKPSPSAAEPAKSLQVAQWLAAAAESIWTKETGLFKAPLADGAQKCNGGDALLDIYVVGMSWTKDAQVKPYPPGDVKRPAWAWIDPGPINSAEDARDTLSHEFFHTISLNYNLSRNEPGVGTAIEYGWLDEATATWAIDFVHAPSKFEHRFASKWYSEGAHGVAMGECGLFACGSNGYRDYLFFFYLTRSANSNAVMPAIWTQTESRGSVEAVNQGLGGQYATKWKDFALHTMNRAEYDDFSDWDEITDQIELGPRGAIAGETWGHTAVSLNGLPTRNQPIEPPPTPVSPKAFDWLTYEFPDGNVRDVTFKNYGFASGASSPDVRITAWYELQDGSTHTENWTDGAERSFCRDNPEENLKRLVVFYTNGRATPYISAEDAASWPKESGALVTSKDACDPVPYDVTYSGVSRRKDPNFGSIDVTTQFSGTMRVEPDAPGFQQTWTIDTGTLNVQSISGTAGACSVSSSGGNYSLPLPGEAAGYTLYRAVGGANPQYYANVPWVVGNPPATIPVTFTGPNCDGEESTSLYAWGQWLMFHPGTLTPQPNGTITATVHSTLDPEWTHDFTFSFVPDWDG